MLLEEMQERKAADVRIIGNFHKVQKLNRHLNRLQPV